MKEGQKNQRGTHKNWGKTEQSMWVKGVYNQSKFEVIFYIKSYSNKAFPTNSKATFKEVDYVLVTI